MVYNSKSKAKTDAKHTANINISHGAFHSRFKELKALFFSKFFYHSHLSLSQAHLTEFDHSMFGRSACARNKWLWRDVIYPLSFEHKLNIKAIYRIISHRQA